MLNILVLCTGNSCRSILGEALINHLGNGRLKAWSAGSHPVGTVHPRALETLAVHGIPVEGCYFSKSWEELEQEDFDIVITVCDNAAGETCPAYLNPSIKVHWGLPDPARVQGSHAKIKVAFEKTYKALDLRIGQMLELPLEKLSPVELETALNRIGSSNP